MPRQSDSGRDSQPVRRFQPGDLRVVFEAGVPQAAAADLVGGDVSWPWSRLYGVSDRQGFQPAKAEVFAPDQRLAGQLKIGEPAQQRFEGDLPFEAGQRCAEAEMGGPAEGQMAVVGAIEIEAVGIGKRSGSRLPAAMTAITACRLRICLPPSTTSSGASRAVCWLGLS